MRTITYILLAFVAVLTFAFTGCKKDKNEKQEANIVGRWQFVKSDYKETINGQTTTQSNAAPIDSFIEFKSDGAFIGQTQGSISGRWVINNNRLHIDGGGAFESFDSGYEIRKLTSSELVIYSKDVDGSYSSEETIYLKK